MMSQAQSHANRVAQWLVDEDRRAQLAFQEKQSAIYADNKEKESSNNIPPLFHLGTNAMGRMLFSPTITPRYLVQTSSTPPTTVKEQPPRTLLAVLQQRTITTATPLQSPRRGLLPPKQKQKQTKRKQHNLTTTMIGSESSAPKMRLRQSSDRCRTHYTDGMTCSIEWTTKVPITLNEKDMAKLVWFKHGHAVVRCDEKNCEHDNCKFSQLNGPAVVKLTRCWPFPVPETTASLSDLDVRRAGAKFQRYLKRVESHFKTTNHIHPMTYDKPTGTLTLKIDRFL